MKLFRKENAAEGLKKAAVDNANLVTCKHCGYAYVDSIGSDKFCSQCGSPLEANKTNFENIKAMTIDELAAFLCNLFDADGCFNLCPAHSHCLHGHTGMKDWLESEVSNDE